MNNFLGNKHRISKWLLSFLLLCGMLMIILGLHQSQVRKERLNERREMIDSVEKAYRNNDLLSSAVLLQKLREDTYSENQSTDYQTILSYLVKLNISLDDYEEALALNAETLSHSLELNDSTAWLRNLIQKGSILFYMKKYDESFETFSHAHYIAVQCQDSMSLFLTSRNMAGVKAMKGSFTEALQFLDRATEEHPASAGNFDYDFALSKANILYSLGKTTEGDSITDYVITDCNPASDDALMTYTLRMKAIHHSDKGDSGKGLEYLSRTNGLSLSPMARYFLYLDFAKLYERIQNYKSASIYKDSALLMYDSIHTLAQSSYHRISKQQFDIFRHEQQLQQYKARNKLTIIVSILIGLIGSGIVIFLIYRRKMERKIAAYRSDTLKKALHSYYDENATLKTELQKNKQDLATVMLSVNARNETVQAAIDYMSHDKSRKETKAILHDLKELVKDSNNIDSFLSLINEINPAFFSTLAAQYPDLTQNDIRYLSLVYSHLTPAEIASLLGITPEAARKRKQRIMKKMKLEPSDDLYLHLLSL